MNKPNPTSASVDNSTHMSSTKKSKVRTFELLTSTLDAIDRECASRDSDRNSMRDVGVKRTVLEGLIDKSTTKDGYKKFRAFVSIGSTRLDIEDHSRAIDRMVRGHNNNGVIFGRHMLKDEELPEVTFGYAERVSPIAKHGLRGDIIRLTSKGRHIVTRLSGCLYDDDDDVLRIMSKRIQSELTQIDIQHLYKKGLVSIEFGVWSMTSAGLGVARRAGLIANSTKFIELQSERKKLTTRLSEDAIATIAEWSQTIRNSMNRRVFPRNVVDLLVECFLNDSTTTC